MRLVITIERLPCYLVAVYEKYLAQISKTNDI